MARRTLALVITALLWTNLAVALEASSSPKSEKNAPVEFQKFPDAPKQNSDPLMAKIADIGRQIARLKKQSVDMNRLALDASERSQKIFLKVAEIRFATSSRSAKQAALELEASKNDMEASSIDKKRSESQASMTPMLRSEMSERAALLRLKATEARAKSSLLAIEGSETQMKVDQLYAEANRDNVAAAKHRVTAMEADRKIDMLEKQMQDLADQSHDKPKTQNVR